MKHKRKIHRVSERNDAAMTQCEVAKALGLTQQNLFWIERKALEKMRKTLTAMGFGSSP